MEKKRVLIIGCFALSIVLIILSVVMIVKTSNKLKQDNNGEVLNNTKVKGDLEETKVDYKGSIKVYKCNGKSGYQVDCSPNGSWSEEIIETETMDPEILFLGGNSVLFLDGKKIKLYKNNKINKINTGTVVPKIILAGDNILLFKEGKDVKLYHDNKIDKIDMTENIINTLSQYEGFHLVKDNNKLYGLYAYSNGYDVDLGIYYKNSIYYDVINKELKFKDEYNAIISEIFNDKYLEGRKCVNNNIQRYLIDIDNYNIFISNSSLDGNVTYDKDRELYIFEYKNRLEHENISTIYNKNGKLLLDQVYDFKQIDKNYYYFKDNVIYKTDTKFKEIKNIGGYKPIYIMHHIPYAIVKNNNDYLLLNIETSEIFKISTNDNSELNIAEATGYYKKITMNGNVMNSSFQIEKGTTYKFNPGIYIALYKSLISEPLGHKFYVYYFNLETKEMSEVPNVINLNVYGNGLIS